MNFPDGMVFIYHGRKDGVDLEQKELIMCGSCRHEQTPVCPLNTVWAVMPSDFYCAMAERRTDETN